MKDHIERLRISKSAAFFCLTGVLAVTTIAALRILRPPVVTTGDSYLNQLIAREHSLQENTQLAVDQANATRMTAERNLWGEEALAAWKQKLPEKWTAQDVSVTEGMYVNTRRILLTRKDAASRDYAEILSMLHRCEDLQGAHIQNLVISSSDPARHRFDLVQLLIVFSIPKSGRNPAS